MGSAVLVVHSDHLLRELARQALESAGHAVAEAADVQSSVRMAQAAPPDLFLIEWTEHPVLRATLDRLRDEPGTSQSRVVVWVDQSDIHEAIHALSAFEPPPVLPPCDLARLAEVLESNGLAPIASYHLETCALGAGVPAQFREKLLSLYQGVVNDNVYRVTLSSPSASLLVPKAIEPWYGVTSL